MVGIVVESSVKFNGKGLSLGSLDDLRKLQNLIGKGSREVKEDISSVSLIYDEKLSLMLEEFFACFAKAGEKLQDICERVYKEKLKEDDQAIKVFYAKFGELYRMLRVIRL